MYKNASHHPRCSSPSFSPFLAAQAASSHEGSSPVWFSFPASQILTNHERTAQTVRGRNADPSCPQLCLQYAPHEYARADPCPMTEEWVREVCMNMSDYSSTHSRRPVHTSTSVQEETTKQTRTSTRRDRSRRLL
jgi:hypothetical protein